MISIIVPCYNNHTSLTVTLSGLEKQKQSGEFEVIVVDSSDERYTYSGPLKLRYLFQEHRTYAGIARNIGAGVAEGSVLVFLDSKVVPEEDALNKIAALDIKNSIYSASLEMSPLSSFWGKLKHLLFFSGFQSSVPKDQRDNLPSTFLVLSRTAFFLNDGFTSLVRQQDTEFTERLRNNGWRLLFEPKIKCTLVNSEDFPTLVYKVFFDGAGYTFRKNDKRLVVFLPFIGILKFMRIGLRNLWWNLNLLSIGFFVPTVFMSLVWIAGGYSAMFGLPVVGISKDPK